jgi:hypothetical protein
MRLPPFADGSIWAMAGVSDRPTDAIVETHDGEFR